MKVFLCSIIFIIGYYGFSQKDYEEYINIVHHIESYDLLKAEKLATKLKDGNFKNIVLFKINYLKEGVFKTPLPSSIGVYPHKKQTTWLNVFSTTVYGFYLHQTKKNNDSTAFEVYLNAFKKADSLNDTLLINHSLRGICATLFNNTKSITTFKKYIGLYKMYSNNAIDSFWSTYYELAELQIEHLANKKNRNIILPFDRLYDLARGNNYFEGLTHQLHGIFYDVIQKNYLSAEYHFREAIKLFEKIPYHYASRKVFGNKVNLGISLFYQKQNKASIAVFENALRDKKNIKLDDKLFIYKWLQKVYDSLNQIDNAYVFSKKADSLKEVLKKYNHAISIKELDIKYDYSKKEKENNQLNQTNKYLQKNLNTLIPILGFTTLLLAIIYYLYRRYRKKSTVLEEEKSETLQKLDELKQIVIKNHIVLKDKTKVYIADLMYIKADDHYLNLFLSNGKDHFVRGKLKNIKEELPPNFIQCHRSYIVNVNFIKQKNTTALVMINQERIPVSRLFKGSFDSE